MGTPTPQAQAVCKLMADCQQHLRASAGQVAGWEDHLPLGDRADEGLGKAGRQGVALRTHVELERSLNYRIRQAELEVGGPGEREKEGDGAERREKLLEGCMCWLAGLSGRLLPAGSSIWLGNGCRVQLEGGARMGSP